MKFIQLLLLLCCFSSLAFGQEASQPEAMSFDQQRKAIQDLGDQYQNSIPILQNRFRIDYLVDEVSMVFFREYGSAPVVLVKPDGSKLFQSRPNDQIEEWRYGPNWDVIKIKKPTPGPWQALGQIIPGSRVMVLTDIELHVDPLPKRIFAGEILKQTGYLTNGGEPIDIKEFRDVVNLSIFFASTNNPNYDNFGVGMEEVTRFEDNGRGMDEYPMDGVFTGQYNLTIGPGEWQPVYYVNTPLYRREQRATPIVLYPSPVKLDIKIADESQSIDYHELSIDVNRDLVQLKSLLVDGKVRYPGGEVRNFSLTETSEEVRKYQIHNLEYGIFRIQLTVLGVTTEGRHFILNVPEYSFLVESPRLASQNGGSENTDGQSSSNNTQVIDPLAGIDFNQTLPQEEDELNIWLLITFIGVNVILVLGAGAFVFMIIRKKKKAQKEASNDESQTNAEKEQDEDSSELTMPDEK